MYLPAASPDFSETTARLMLRGSRPPWPDEAVVGPAHVHRILRGWLAALGHEAYASSDSPGESVTTRVAGATEAT